jgi:hypothetical protein
VSSFRIACSAPCRARLVRSTRYYATITIIQTCQLSRQTHGGDHLRPRSFECDSDCRVERRQTPGFRGHIERVMRDGVELAIEVYSGIGG